jgi:DNA polymerase I
MGPQNLSRQLGISFKEAQGFIDRYFEQFPSIKNFMQSCIDNARKLGYTETLFGRRRYLSDIGADNRMVREAAERVAVNTPVQGTAADIIKIAMITIHNEIGRAWPSARMLLQVHDELVFEVPVQDGEAFAEWAKEKMASACQLCVPLKVDAGIGNNWSSAH